MDWQKVKRLDETLFNDDGVAIEVDMVDGSFRSVTIRSYEKVIRIQAGQYSGIEVLEPAPPPTEKRFLLKGVAHTLKVFESFRSRDDANQRLRDLRSADPGSNLKVEEVEVIVSGVEAPTDDDLPF